jgi:Zn-finger nucleic acid-binding protein
MARNNFGKKSRVIVDICRRHGVWFDAGELPRVLAFVRSGGLTAPGAREEAALSTRPATEGVRYAEGRGVEHRAPERAVMESTDSVGQMGRDILDGLLEGLFGDERHERHEP